MTNNNFIFKLSNKDKWNTIHTGLLVRLHEFWKNSKEDFQVEIKPYSKRSLNALNTYWMLINAIVKWDSGNNGLKSDVWDEWFKKEARLVEEFDNMPLWTMKYYKYLVLEKGYGLFENLGADYKLEKEGEEDILLGKRYIQKTRSIANKGDVTKIEMERLIESVLKFGSDNGVQGCFIKDVELERLLKSYK